MVALLYPVILDRFYAMYAANGHPRLPLNLIFALIIGILVFLKHWENVKRLWNHTERKVSFGKKNKDEAENAPSETKKPKKSLHHDDDDDEVQE